MIHVSSDIKNEVMAKMEETLNIFRAKHPAIHLPTPQLAFRQTGRRAGLCTFNFTTKACTITINPDFFKNHHEDMIGHTVPHEVSHYISFMVYGRLGRGHSHYWKSVMRSLGRKPDRCHSYDLDGVKTRTVAKPFKYICACKEPHMFTPLRHTKVVSKRATYSCRICRKRLVYWLDVGKQSTLPVETPKASSRVLSSDLLSDIFFLPVG